MHICQEVSSDTREQSGRDYVSNAEFKDKWRSGAGVKQSFKNCPRGIFLINKENNTTTNNNDTIKLPKSFIGS